MRSRTAQATDEDKAAAEYIKQLHRGFAGGAPIRHKGVAQEIHTFLKEATSSKLKQLAKAAVVKPLKPNPNKEGNDRGGQGAGREK